MPNYKLSYFNGRGGAEVPRLLFKIAEVEFEDVRYTVEEWPNHKSEMPLQAMPVLEFDGKTFCQSNAIARYLAKTFGLMGSNVMEEFKIDELQEVVCEILIKHVIPAYYEKDDARKKEQAIKLEKETLPMYFDFIERRLKENNDGKGFYVGDKISLGDVLIYNTMFGIRFWYTTVLHLPIFEDRPLLNAHYERIDSYPQIAAWVKVRPQTPF